MAVVDLEVVAEEEEGEDPAEEGAEISHFAQYILIIVW